MKKLLLICILLICILPMLFSAGCASVAIPARMEVDSAEVVNDVIIMKKQFNVYADAAEEAATDNDKKVLKALKDKINNNFDQTYNRALEHYKDIKDYRNK